MKRQYLTERNLVIWIEDETFKNLPAQMQERMKPYDEPKIPEFLQNKKDASNSLQPENKADISNGIGSSDTGASKKIDTNIGKSKAGVSTKSRGRPAKR